MSFIKLIWQLGIDPRTERMDDTYTYGAANKRGRFAIHSNHHADSGPVIGALLTAVGVE